MCYINLCFSYLLTYNGVFVVGQSKEDISDCEALTDDAMATKFWPKYAKISQKWPKLQLCATYQCNVWF